MVKFIQEVVTVPENECLNGQYGKLPIFITAAALILAEGRSIEELTLMSVVFTQLGDTLATIATEKGITEI